MGARAMQSERDRAIAKICELIIECGSPPDRLFPARKGPQVQDVEKRLQDREPHLARQRAYD